MPCPNQATRPFPVADALPSYWRKHAHSIDEYRSTAHLPDHCDIVIIGAGYSGASIAHHLIEQNVSRNRQIPSILILEAREACSGATGRNGGHLKPDPLFRAANVLKSHGKAAAEHVASFEARQVSEVRDLIEREGIDCDFEETTVTDVCTYSEGRDAIKASLSEVAKAGISTAKEIQYFEGDEACEVSGVRGAKCCLTYNAARLWPYRLVSHLLEKATSQGVNLQTHTPVLSVTPSSETLKALPWSVNTPRGSVRCSTVIHATNAYSSALLPELRGKIVPVRGVVARLAGEDVPEMTDSFMMRFSQYEYDYMIPRPDRSIVVGGARRDHYADLDEWFNVTDDSRVTKSAHEYFDGYMQRHFRGWENSNTRTEELWTGVMGYSNDGFPYVGRVCAKDGQYVCAGFTGHGMPQIFLSAKAIALMITTGATDEEANLPIPYRVSPERWYQDKEHESLKAWRNVTKKMHPHASL